jgi:hypothetical protein
LVILLIDKEYNEDGSLKTKVYYDGLSPLYCYETGPNGEEAGGSCVGVWGGAANMISFATSTVCDAATPLGFRPERPIILFTQVVLTGQHVYLANFAATITSTSKMKYFECLFNRSTVNWGARPSHVFEYIKMQVSNNTAITNEYFVKTYGISGPSGVATNAEDITDSILQTLSNSFSCPYDDYLRLTLWKIIVSLYNDLTDVIVPDPGIPDPDDPPVDPGVNEYFDLWNDYVDGDATVQTLNGGVGWFAAAAWVLNTIPSIEGKDEFEAYVDGVQDFLSFTYSPLNQDEGWGGEWHFSDENVFFYGKDDFQDYVDGDYTFNFDTPLIQGENWALVSGLEIFGVKEPWHFGPTILGLESWEFYTDQTVTGTTVLDHDDTGGSWVIAQWRFNGT